MANAKMHCGAKQQRELTVERNEEVKGEAIPTGARDSTPKKEECGINQLVRIHSRREKGKRSSETQGVINFS